MEKLKISDLLDYKFLSGIVASPSGKKAAFLAKQANKEKNSYDSWAYIADFSHRGSQETDFLWRGIPSFI